MACIFGRTTSRAPNSLPMRQLHASPQDADYEAAGAVLGSTGDAFGRDIVLKIRPPHETSEVSLLRPGSSLISFLHPAQNKGLVDALAQKRVSALGATSTQGGGSVVYLCLASSIAGSMTIGSMLLVKGAKGMQGYVSLNSDCLARTALPIPRQISAPPPPPAAMDCIPRTISRAQTFDALSSMANIAGYRCGGASRCTHAFAPGSSLPHRPATPSQGCDRGRNPLWPLLHRADHGRRPRAPRQDAGHRRGRGGAVRHRHGQEHGGGGPCLRHPRRRRRAGGSPDVERGETGAGGLLRTAVVAWNA